MNVSETLDEPDAEPDKVPVPQPLPDGLAEKQPLALALPVASDADGTPDAVNEPVPLALELADTEKVPVGVHVPLGEPDVERDAVGDTERVAVEAALIERDGEPLDDGEPLGEKVPVDVHDSEVHALCDSVPDGELLTVPVGDVDSVRVRVDDAVGDTLTVFDAVPLADWVDERDGEPLDEREKLGEADGDDESESVPVRAGVPDVVLERLWLLVKLGDGDADIEPDGVRDAEDVGERDGFSDADEKGDVVVVTVPVRVTACHGVKVARSELEYDAEFVKDPELVGDVVREIDGDADGDRVRLVEPVVLGEPVMDGEPLGESDPLIEREADGEAVDDVDGDAVRALHAAHAAPVAHGTGARPRYVHVEPPVSKAQLVYVLP